ncbi:response regulator [Paenibacillus andongensis]|uniref:response regulator n=1 Tax=Paenibacillus andongensis TaxID=2975482 RepID=UPI0021BB5EB8|nr:response regulator [Paenibacillus andongensis]
MIKVLIVDDEFLIVQLIKNSIDWNSLGMEIVGEAFDGEMALECISQMVPQIIIMDINIPFINGIELSQIIRERHPELMIIMLTGYAEFEYVKEAINIGVISYLQKPLEHDEFIRALLKAKSNIMERSSQIGIIRNMEYKSQLNEKEQFLNRLLVADNSFFVPEEPIKEKCNLFQIQLNADSLMVCIISIDHLKEKFNDEFKIKLRTFAVLNVSTEILSQFYPAVVFNGSDDQVIVLLSTEGQTDDRLQRTFKLIFGNIRNFIHTHFGLTITMAVGGVHQGYTNVPVSYKEALYAMKQRFVSGNNQVIFVKEANESTEVPASYSPAEVMIDLRLANYDSAVQKVNQTFKELKEERTIKEVVMLISVGFISVLTEFIVENNLAITHVLKNKAEFFDYLNRRETLIEVDTAVKHLFQETIRYVSSHKKSITVKVVEKAKTFLESHYANADLTIEEIAHHLYLNPSHLSRVFRKELNCSLVEYLTKIRLGKAKELLDGDLKITLSDITEQVGYSDPYYFSKCFKKFFGVTPTVYIENKSK